MSQNPQPLVILYADVTGSTSLYEQFGDELASTDIHSLIDLLASVAEQHQGKKIKTIGDEIMCLFQTPEPAARAAIRMNQALEEANEEQLFSCGNLHIKIGWHYGQGAFRDDDVIGEAPTVAQQVISMARRDEILTTGTCVDALPAQIRCTTKFIDRIEAQDGSGDVDVYCLPWDEDDNEATVVTNAPQQVTVDNAHTALILNYADRQITMNDQMRHCHVGRGEDNELVVHGEFTSRRHAEIHFRHGRFHLVDKSTNGTVVIQGKDDLTRLHREEVTLHDSGTLCFGGAPKTDPGAAVQYQCVQG